MNKRFTITNRPGSFTVTEDRRACNNGPLRLAAFSAIGPAILSAVLFGALAVGAAEKPAMATKATACFEEGGFTVRLVDAEGKKHKYSVFPIIDGTDTEWSEFEHSRKIVAMDDGARLTVKQGKDERGEWQLFPMGEIKRCAESKRAKFPKL